MKYLFWGPQNIFSLEKPTGKIYFQALHHLEDIRWLLSNKHNENIHEIPFLGSVPPSDCFK
jgi:hypothetical protein